MSKCRCKSEDPKTCAAIQFGVDVEQLLEFEACDCRCHNEPDDDEEDDT